MKPIIIYLNEKNDKITLTKSELEKFIEDAYNAGKAETTTIYYTPFTSPSTISPNTINPPYIYCGQTIATGTTSIGTGDK